MKNVSQKVVIIAWDTTNNVYKTGDGANFTVRGTQDGVEFTPASPNVTEIDSTNMKGRYQVTIGATENTGELMTCGGVSSTAAIVIFDARWSNLQGNVVRSGVAQNGAATTITLDTAASATNSFYNRCQVSIVAGTGSGESGQIITGYVGATKVATVSPGWTTNPDSTSVFMLTGAAADMETWLATAVILNNGLPKVSAVPASSTNFSDNDVMVGG